MKSSPSPTNRDQNPESPQNKPQLPWFIIIFGFILLLQLYAGGRNFQGVETNWREFETEMLAPGDVEKIVLINKERAEIYLTSAKQEGKSGPHRFLTIGSVESFEGKLEKAGEKHQLEELPDIRFENRTNWLPTILGWLLPLFLIILFWIFIINRVRGGGMGGNNIFDFGKSKATLFDTNNQSKVTFEDVAGLEEAKLEVQEIVQFLKDPDQFTRLGAKIPKGVILVGPPGTGKTLMAKAVAGEAQVAFFHISGSEFVEMFVGVGASRVRDLFKKAKEKAPCIIFIDEIDAIGRARGNSLSLRSNDERESTLNQLLAEMDGFDSNSGVIVLAATNRADILDKALLRPGRFDRHIYLELPNLIERKAIFGVHLRQLQLGDDISVDHLAGQTPGFSGADIANICNEAALVAARNQKEAIDMQDFMEAIDRIIAGPEKKSKIISAAEKKIIAYHEAGHATVSWFLKHSDELVKITIVPRGKSLGAAWYLPEEHQIRTKAQFLDAICTALGGRAAEDLIFGEISSGALDDLEKVTKQAYTMVAYYGLNEHLGHLSFYDSTGQYAESLQKPYSDATAELIDIEVRNLIKNAFERTKKILQEHRAQLETLAELLLEKETILRDDLERIFGKRSSSESPTSSPEAHP